MAGMSGPSAWPGRGMGRGAAVGESMAGRRPRWWGATAERRGGGGGPEGGAGGGGGGGPGKPRPPDKSPGGETNPPLSDIAVEARNQGLGDLRASSARRFSRTNGT